MSKKLLILSDSHGFNNLIDEVLKKEQGKYDYACCAGDYCTEISYMKQCFNWFVDGNNDYGYKDIQTFKIENLKFVLVHSQHQFSFDKNKYFSALRELGKQHQANVVIYGHTHYQDIDQTEEPILVNPGSIALPRGPKKIGSYVIATIDKDKISFKVKYI